MPTTNADPVVIIGAGQSGLAAARAVRDRGARPVILEAGPDPSGSWPAYYDSLRLFSPVAYSSMPGLPFPGEPDHYPTRSEVAAYLRTYAERLGVEIRTGQRVSAVRQAGGALVVDTASGDTIPAAGVVAASGSFGNPHRPELPGRSGFTGQVLHSAEYRNPQPYQGKRVVVVGGGNSAIQIAYELAQVATTTIATRAPLRFMAQRILGHDLHYWLKTTGFDNLPPHWLAQVVKGPLVMDTGAYANALKNGLLDRRPVFTSFDGDQIHWADGRREQVDVVIFATGYRPALGYLQPLGALDEAGNPKQVGGISTTQLGLAYVGLEFQRSFASNTLRGVHRDAEHVADSVVAYAGNAPAVFGL